MLGPTYACCLFANKQIAKFEEATKCTLQVWRLDDPQHPHTLVPETGTVMYGLSLGGDHLALVHNRATVRVYDVSSGITLVREYTPPQGTQGFGHYAKAALSEDVVAASDGRKKNICLWKRESGEIMRTLTNTDLMSPMYATLTFHGATLVHSGPGTSISQVLGWEWAKMSAHRCTQSLPPAPPSISKGV